MKKWISIGFFLLLFSSPSYAITSVTCEANDSDCDGYTEDGTGEGYDCDDAAPLLPAMPWTYDGCTSGQARKCNTGTGAYGACATPTEGSTNYYVDCDAGSDAAACSFAAPCLTFLKFADYINTSEPAGYIDLAAGRTVWVKGTCTETYNDTPTRPSFYTRTDGSVGNPWRVWSPLPTGNTGWSATFNVSATCDGTPMCPAGSLVGVAYGDIRGIEFTGGYHDGTVDAEGGGFVWDDVDNVTFMANSIHDNGGTSGENPCGINASNGPTNSTVSHNYIYDNRDPDASVAENERNLCFFSGTGNAINYNRIQNTEPFSDTADGTGCFVWKHGQDSATNEIAYNIIENCVQTGIGSGNSGTHIHHNLLINPETCVMLHNFGGSTYVKSNVVEYNTCYASTSGLSPNIYHEPELSGGVHAVDTFRYNIFVANTADYGHYGGAITVWPDDNTAWGVYDDGTHIASDNNCYYNAGAGALEFTGGSTDYTFVQWKALASSAWDQSSVNLNPTLDSAYASTANCTTMGWREASGGGGGASATLNRQLMLGVGF